MLRGLTALAADKFATAARKRDRSEEDLSLAIMEAYINTSDLDRMLRGTISDIMLENGGRLMRGKHEDMFDQLVENSPEFAADMAKALSKSLKRKRSSIDEDPEEISEDEDDKAVEPDIEEELEYHPRYGPTFGVGWYFCGFWCGGTTYSAAVLNGERLSVHRIRCSRCQRIHRCTAKDWKNHYSALP